MTDAEYRTLRIEALSAAEAILYGLHDSLPCDGETYLDCSKCVSLDRALWRIDEQLEELWLEAKKDAA